MIFVGDIALPFKKAIEIKDLPSRMGECSWFGNLEGAFTDNCEAERSKRIVYNDRDAVADLPSRFRFKGFALANNHIVDTGSYVLTYLKTEDLHGDHTLIDQLTPFTTFDDDKYRSWYKYNRYHRRKGLPIYYWNDPQVIVKSKNLYNKFRDSLIYLLATLGLK